MKRADTIRHHDPVFWIIITVLIFLAAGGGSLGAYFALWQTSSPSISLPEIVPAPTLTPAPTPPVPTAKPTIPGYTPTPTPTPTPRPSLPPEFFLDSDGDGFNDWFETNIAGTDPNIPNNRYIVLFLNLPDQPSLTVYMDKAAQFFIEKGKVPSKNVILLLQEEATKDALQKAIEEVAAKAGKNDIVFINISVHGGEGIFMGSPNTMSYTLLDSWLDKIVAKVVIVNLGACESESALPVLKDGPCPRIVFIWYGEFLSALGIDTVGNYPVGNYFVEVDSKYGNGDGYVSLKEISNWYENDWKWQSPMTLETGKGIHIMLDPSNIASKIYLTDYTPKG